MREKPQHRRSYARAVRWVVVIVLYGAAVTYAAGLGEQPTPAVQAAADVTAPADPAPESPLLTLSIAAGATAGFGAYRLTAVTARRRQRRAIRRSVAPEPLVVQR